MVGVIRCKHHNSYHYHLSLREQPYNIIPLTQSVGASHLMRVEMIIDFIARLRLRYKGSSLLLRSSSPGGFTAKSSSYDYRDCFFLFYTPCFCYFCVNRSVNRVNQNERNNQGFMLQIYY